jgi:hypothetical protein
VKYIALPVMLFLLALLLAVLMIALLPPEIAYNFRISAPDSRAALTAFLAGTLAPQLFLAALAWLIVWGMLKLSRRFRQAESRTINRLLTIMGNMVALPQLILVFAMLDVFLYNASGAHLMPLWLFAAVVMTAGVFVLGAIFLQALQARQKP